MVGVQKRWFLDTLGSAITPGGERCSKPVSEIRVSEPGSLPVFEQFELASEVANRPVCVEAPKFWSPADSRFHPIVWRSVADANQGIPHAPRRTRHIALILVRRRFLHCGSLSAGVARHRRVR